MGSGDDDPFAPPGENVPTLDLHVPPRRAGTASDAEIPLPQPRKPTKYRRPSTGWVMVLTLVLAAIGFAAVGLFVWTRVTDKTVKSLFGNTLPTLPGTDPRRIRYTPLEMDAAVLIDIEVKPRNALVTLDGQALPSNPLRLPRDGDTHQLEASADGYETGIYTFRADKPKTVQLKLVRAPAGH